MARTSRLRPVAALAFVLMLVVASAGGATAAAPSVDTSTTDDTSTTSEVAGGDTLANFTANSSESTTLQYKADSNESKVYIEGKTGIQIYSNTTPTQVFWNNTDNDGHFNVSVNHGALADMEHAIGENVSTTWFMVNNTSASSPASSNITVYVEWDNSTTVENVGDADVGGIASVTNETGPFGSTFSFLGTTSADVETDERKVNGSSTDVIIALSNDSVQNMFDDGVSSVSSGAKLSSLLSTTRTVATVTSDDGKTVAVPVFYKSAPDTVSEDTTYAVYKQVGGTWALSVNLGDTFEDADKVSVHAIGSAGTTTMATAYLTSGLSNLGGMFGAFSGGALLGMVPIAAGRRELAS